MKAKLLKQIRKRFEIKSVYRSLSTNEYLLRDKKTGLYYSSISFYGFIRHISYTLDRFFEIESYIKKKRNKYDQRSLKREFYK